MNDMGWRELLDSVGEKARTAREYVSPWKYLSATDIASFAPGGGLVNAWQDSGRGWQNLKAGNWGQAAIDYGNMGLNLAGEVPALGMAVMAGKKGVKGIRAFHGSPHDFDRFDMSKIGTGEGAQAYGHGLYFAENEGVARGYRDALSKSGNDGAMWRLEKAGGDVDAAIAKAQERIATYRQGGAEHYAAAVEDDLRALQRYKETGQWTPGRMYEVRINADPEHFLDWDKPLSEQSESVRQILQERYPQYFEERMLNPFTRMPVEFPPNADAAKLRDFYVNQQGYPIERAADSMTAKTLAERHNFDPPSMSRELNEAGIPGIKYLDAGSRAAGDGSRNYVVFDDRLVEILKKYGWAPGMAIPAAAMLEYENAGQPPQM